MDMFKDVTTGLELAALLASLGGGGYVGGYAAAIARSRQKDRRQLFELASDLLSGLDFLNSRQEAYALAGGHVDEDTHLGFLELAQGMQKAASMVELLPRTDRWAWQRVEAELPTDVERYLESLRQMATFTATSYLSETQREAALTETGGPFAAVRFPSGELDWSWLARLKTQLIVFRRYQLRFVNPGLFAWGRKAIERVRLIGWRVKARGRVARAQF